MGTSTALLLDIPHVKVLFNLALFLQVLLMGEQCVCPVPPFSTIEKSRRSYKENSALATVWIRVNLLVFLLFFSPPSTCLD